jgi:hypothetical protein
VWLSQGLTVYVGCRLDPGRSCEYTRHVVCWSTYIELWSTSISLAMGMSSVRMVYHHPLTHAPSHARHPSSSANSSLTPDSQYLPSPVIPTLSSCSVLPSWTLSSSLLSDRRKSWIILRQFIVTSLMLYISWHVDALLVKVRPSD